MLQTINTDSGLTVYGIIRDASDNLANGSTFETYNASHWNSLYKISAPEQGSSGHYQLTVPAYLTAGDYTVAFYQQVGGSAAVGDPALGSHNFTVSDSEPAPADLTTFIDKLRTLANDTDTSNQIYGESPSGKVDGVRTNFRLQNRNIVSGSVYLSYGTTYRTQAGFTVDVDNGIITFSVAPAASTELNFDYCHHWFTDTDLAEFLNEAAAHTSANDPTEVDDGLVSAMLQYALGYFWLRRSSQYAQRYSSAGGMGASAGADIITQNFRKLSEAAFKAADSFREMFYKRQGMREAPASATVTYSIDPYTPQR